MVSLLLYLDAGWPRDWAAETLFLDDGTDTGIVVRPRPYRAVLMDQVLLEFPDAMAGLSVIGADRTLRLPIACFLHSGNVQLRR